MIRQIRELVEIILQFHPCTKQSGLLNLHAFSQRFIVTEIKAYCLSLLLLDLIQIYISLSSFLVTLLNLVLFVEVKEVVFWGYF